MTAPEQTPQHPADDPIHLRKYAVRWALVFVVLISAMAFALWWSSRALEYSTARMQETAKATYKVRGEVIDKITGKPVAWADLEDDPSGRPPRFRTSADHLGRFELLTFAEPHRILVSALGYRPSSLRTGKDWYLWMPKGEEQVRVELEPE